MSAAVSRICLLKLGGVVFRVPTADVSKVGRWLRAMKKLQSLNTGGGSGTNAGSGSSKPFVLRLKAIVKAQPDFSLAAADLSKMIR